MTTHNRRLLMELVGISAPMALMTPSSQIVDPSKRIVYLIRHGQSLANVHDHHANEPIEPEYLRDARLTDLGLQQASTLQGHVHDLNVELVVISPLTRALQTACIAFERHAAPTTVWPVVTEFYSDHAASCRGRDARDILSDPNLLALPKFHTLDLSHVDDEWWHISTDPSRIDTFKSWLASIPEKRIAVVCHWGFISSVLGGVSVNNCEWIETVWQKEQGPTPAYKSISLIAKPRDSAIINPLLHQIGRMKNQCDVDPVLASAVHFPEFHVPVLDSFPVVDLESAVSFLQDHAASLSYSDWKFDYAQMSCDGTLHKLSARSNDLKSFATRIRDAIDPVARPPIRTTLHAPIVTQPSSLDAQAIFDRIHEQYPLLSSSQPDMHLHLNEIDWDLHVVEGDAVHAVIPI